MSSTTIGPAISVTGRRTWQIAQGLGLAATVVLIAGLATRPDIALTALWNVAIPLLPATFLISPALWRNVCPLGTLNMLTSRPGRANLGAPTLPGNRRVPPDRLLPWARMAGMVLLLVLVPARRFLFNTNGAGLAVVIVVVALLAVALGAVYGMKSGFCNAICPVLPVERLYGQSPLVKVVNPRCAPCTGCTPRGCLDLGPEKSIAQTLGRSRRSHAWLRSDFGVFAASFPGFVLGYNMTVDGPLSSAGTVYATVAVWAVGSYAITYVFVHALRLEAAEAMRLLALSAVVAYYWFAAPVVTAALGLAGWAPGAIRTAAFALVGVWMAVAVWRARDGRTGVTYAR